MSFLPFIPFEDCVDVYLDFIQQSIPWAVTMTVKSAVAVDGTVLDDLSGVIDAWWTTDQAALVSNNVAFRDIKLTDLTSDSGIVRHYTPATGAGTLTGSALPASAALVVSLLTDLRGRSYRGRHYWAGRVFADQSTVTQWSGAIVNAFDASYEVLKSNLASAGFTLVVASRYNNSVRRTVGVATTITNIAAKANMATQRRRLL